MCLFVEFGLMNNFYCSIEVEIKPVLRSWNLITLTVYEGQILFKVNNQQKLFNESCVTIPANSKFYIGEAFIKSTSQVYKFYITIFILYLNQHKCKRKIFNRIRSTYNMALYILS